MFCACVSHTAYASRMRGPDLVKSDTEISFFMQVLPSTSKGIFPGVNLVMCCDYQDQGAGMSTCPHLLYQIDTHCSFCCRLPRRRPHSAADQSAIYWQVVSIRKVTDIVKHLLKGDIAPRRLSGQSHEVHNNFSDNIVNR